MCKHLVMAWAEIFEHLTSEDSTVTTTSGLGFKSQPKVTQVALGRPNFQYS